MQDQLSRLAGWWLERRSRKRFAGSIFDRFRGLEPLLADCAGESVLDIGSCDGLVAYEFARAGAAVVHGFELDPSDVRFARRLFRDVPGESRFVVADLAGSGAAFERRYGRGLLPDYDTVLFLGVYHHLVRQSSRSAIAELLSFLLRRTRRRLAIRTKLIDDIEPVVVAAGFVASGPEYPAFGDLGPLRIYERESVSRSAGS